MAKLNICIFYNALSKNSLDLQLFKKHIKQLKDKKTENKDMLMKLQYAWNKQHAVIVLQRLKQEGHNLFLVHMCKEKKHAKTLNKYWKKNERVDLFDAVYFVKDYQVVDKVCKKHAIDVVIKGKHDKYIFNPLSNCIIIVDEKPSATFDVCMRDNWLVVNEDIKRMDSLELEPEDVSFSSGDKHNL
jgi:hypothetical protein